MVDLTSQVTLSGYESADSLKFANPNEIEKSVVAADGKVWALQSNGDLWVFGEVSWSNTFDFDLDLQNRAVLLNTDGLLERSWQPLGFGGWEALGNDVLKFAIPKAGSKAGIVFNLPPTTGCTRIRNCNGPRPTILASIKPAIFSG